MPPLNFVALNGRCTDHPLARLLTLTTPTLLDQVQEAPDISIANSITNSSQQQD
jgi:hypothetical protein